MFNFSLHKFIYRESVNKFHCATKRMIKGQAGVMVLTIVILSFDGLLMTLYGTKLN